MSYAYLANGSGIDKTIARTLQDNQEGMNLLVDSGAFTAWKQNKVLSLDAYCGFLDIYPVKPWRYFTLDVVGDPAKTFENYQTMLKRGYKPIPIFTRGEDISMVDEYYKTSDVVGIGGLPQTPNNKGVLKWVMNNGIKGRQAHWLGFTNKNFIKHYKPYSVDSSSWTSGLTYARVLLYTQTGETTQLHKQMFTTRPPDGIVRLLEEYGVSARTLAKTDSWRGGSSVSGRLGAMGVVRAALLYKESFGVRYFPACSTNAALNLLLDGFRYWNRKAA